MSIFPTKILVATDSSEEAELALSTAIELANITNSQLHVVTVAPWVPDPAYAVHEASFRWETYEQTSEAIGKEAQEILDNQVRKIEEGGGSVQEAHLRRGRKDQEIVRVAEEIGAGLIVMGSRGLGGVRRALMGSVSESVFRHAHCPVLVVANRSTRRLSEFLGPFTDYAPNWSPDGSKIAFHSEQAGNRDIYVMDPDRTTDDVTRLTKKAVDDAWAAWSPDGKRIAFASERGSGFADIFVMKPRPESSKNRPKNLTKTEDDVANFKADWQPIPPPP